MESIWRHKRFEESRDGGLFGSRGQFFRGFGMVDRIPDRVKRGDGESRDEVDRFLAIDLIEQAGVEFL